MLSRGSRYKEKEYKIKEFIEKSQGAIKSGYDYRYTDRKSIALEKVLREYGFNSIEDAEAEWKDWLKNQVGSEGIDDTSIINPCTCITHEEYEQRSEISQRIIEEPNNNPSDISDSPEMGIMDLPPVSSSAL